MGKMCPACHGDNMEIKAGENRIGSYVQRVACRCGFEFMRHYALTGYRVETEGAGGFGILDFMDKHPRCIHFESLATARRHQKRFGGELWSMGRDHKFRAGDVAAPRVGPSRNRD